MNVAISKFGCSNIRIYSDIQIISGICIVLTGFEYYFRIPIFEYSTTALAETIASQSHQMIVLAETSNYRTIPTIVLTLVKSAVILYTTRRAWQSQT